VIIDEIGLVEQLGTVEPLSDESFVRAEETLRNAMARSPGRIDPPRPAKHRKLSLRLLTAAAICLVIAAAAAVGIVVTTRAPHSPAHAANHAHKGATSTGGSIRFAGRTLSLPASFQSTPVSCTGAPSSLRGGIEFAGNTYEAAASADGGCIEVWMAPGAVADGEQLTLIPPGTHESVLGHDATLLFDRSTGYRTLYLVLPADFFFPNPDNRDTVDGPLTTVDLVFYAKGLSTAQLKTIAAEGTPMKLLPSGEPCTTGHCG
jgi:hypothetical protein